MARLPLSESDVHVLAGRVREALASRRSAAGRPDPVDHLGPAREREATVDDIVRRVRAGGPHGVNDALTFLEADPWCFRSGYAKERLLDALGHVELDAEQRRRGAGVVRGWVRGPDRREFRRVGRLARPLADDVRAFLEETTRAADPVAARHASWLLADLPAPAAGGTGSR